MPKSSEITYKSEVIRKGIHLFSLLIPICYALLDKITLLCLLIPFTIIVIIVDILSKKENIFRKLIQQLLGSILRPHEKDKKITLNGASWVMIAASITVIVFPKIVAITGITGLIICDISAALIGRKFGHIKFWGKSLEGSLAFFISGVIVVLLIGHIAGMTNMYFISGIIAVFLAAIGEMLSKKAHLDDNFTIPLIICLVLVIMNEYYPFL